MNSDAGAIENLLAWLLQGFDSIVTAPSGQPSSPENGSTLSEFEGSLLNQLDPLDSEEVGNLPTSHPESNHFSIEENLFFELGDKPAVQDRFHTLLKRRLRAEIERNPPRFPWETEVYLYEEAQNGVAPALIPTKFWITQLQNLDLPTAMPEAVLTTLLEQCQAVVQSSLREGAKLVQVVESLFPDQSQTLNHVAGLVLASPNRSAKLIEQVSTRLPTGFPSHYEIATPAQQMVVSLLAAREIMESLTLTVSAEYPSVQRQWMTAAGALTLTVEYQPQEQWVQVQGQLPCQGSLQLQGDQAQSTAQCDDAGDLSVRLTDLEPDSPYSLEVQLATPRLTSLVFAIRLAPELDS
jgi:hypothetical protein